MRASTKAALLMLLAILAGCEILGPGKTMPVTGSFVAVAVGGAFAPDGISECSANVAGTQHQVKDYPAWWQWTGTVIGRGDLAALEITCWFDEEGGTGGYLLLTVPNVRGDRPIPTGRYQVIEFVGGEWTRKENPRVAWSIASVPELRGVYLSSQSGYLEITHSDERIVRGHFEISASRERNP